MPTEGVETGVDYGAEDGPGGGGEGEPYLKTN